MDKRGWILLELGLRGIQGEDAFKLWCWRRLLRVPWTARRPNLKEINPEYSPEGLILKLKLQYLGHLMQRADSLERPWCWERLKAKREGVNRGWDGWMASLNQWTWVWANSGREGRTGKPGLLQSTGSQRVRQDLATEQQLSPSRPPGDHSRGLWTGGGVFNTTFFFFLPESVGLSKRYVAQFQFNGTESFQCVLITQT